MEPWEGATNKEIVRVISMEPGCDPEIKGMMHLAANEGYHKIVRIRSCDGVPVVLQLISLRRPCARRLDLGDYVSVPCRRARGARGLQYLAERRGRDRGGRRGVSRLTAPPQPSGS